MSDTQQWTERDGWILMSLLLVQSEHGASLTAIVGAADATNHAIPTIGELSRALTRLASAGVITVIDHRFKINSTHLDELKAVRQGKGGLFSLPTKGKKWLSSKMLDTQICESVTITNEQLKIAYDEYTQSLRIRKTTNKPMDRSGGSAAS